MSTIRPRTSWTSTPRPPGMVTLDPRQVRGVVVHWPGSKYPLGNPPAKRVASRLEGYRRYHVSGHGWADIAYSVAVDQAGRVWDLRGIRYRSAANGTNAANDQYGAVLFLVGPGENPSTDMIEGFRAWRRREWLGRYPHAGMVYGHSDVKTTTCPGPAVLARIRDGVLTAPGGVTMALTQKDLTAIADAVLDTDGIEVINPPDPKNPKWKVRSVLSVILNKVRVTATVTKETGDQVAALTDQVGELRGQVVQLATRCDSMSVQIGQMLATGVNVEIMANYLRPHIETAVREALVEVATKQGRGK